MNIQRDSWHCRWVVGSNALGAGKRIELNLPVGLCRYFWAVVLTVAVNMLSVAMLVFGGFLVLWLIITKMGGFLAQVKWTAVAVLVSYLVCCGVLWGTVTWISTRATRRLERMATEGVEPQRGLLRSYFRAKLRRVCPLVNFEEGESE